MAENPEPPPPEEEKVSLSFVEKVRFMMYGEQEKEAFLIEKKEKEEKKKGMRTRALSLHQQGWSWTKIATELGCHRTTVMRLVHKWQQTGCIADLPHRRRPPRPQPLLNRQSSPPCSLKSPRWPPEELTLTSNSSNLKRPSSHASRSTTVTVRRRLKELRQQLGINEPPPSPPQPPSQPPPQAPPPLLQLPVRSLRELLSFSSEELSRVLFTDMRVFISEPSGGVKVWRSGRTGPTLDAAREFFRGGGLSATVWACISGGGQRGLLLHVPDELTGDRYVQILHNGLLPSAAAIYGLDAHRFLFAQDRTSIQASPAVEEFLQQQRVQCCEWPAAGHPDLNPCDLLWAEVEAHLPVSSPAPRSTPDLVQQVRLAYESVEPDFVRWLVAPVRLRSLARRMMRAASAS